MARFAVGKRIPDGAVDELDVELSGRIHLFGWTIGDAPPTGLEVAVNGVAVPMCGWFRLHRPDVAEATGGGAWLGMALAFIVRRVDRIHDVAVRYGSKTLVRIRLDLPIRAPDYEHLFEQEHVLQRHDIYGGGPPSPTADPAVVELARTLRGPVLDFGCGCGALVRALRDKGMDARGIEIDRPEISSSVKDDVRPYVKLYDGRFPIPFGDGEFESVVCTEVLEHIPDYEGAVREMARVARMALITVPDISAIPALFPHHVVPWHLLEGTHVNFFTQKSLGKLLVRHFASVSFLRLGVFDVNGTRAYVSLVARCERP